MWTLIQQFQCSSSPKAAKHSKKAASQREKPEGIWCEGNQEKRVLKECGSAGLTTWKNLKGQ